MTWDNKIKDRVYDTTLKPTDAAYMRYLAAVSKASGHKGGFLYRIAVPACAAVCMFVLLFIYNRSICPDITVGRPIIELHPDASLETADYCQIIHPVYLETRNKPVESFVDTAIMPDDRPNGSETFSVESQPDSISPAPSPDYGADPLYSPITPIGTRNSSFPNLNALITMSTVSLTGFLASILSSKPGNIPIAFDAERTDESGAPSCEETTSCQHAFPYRCSLNMSYNIGGTNRITSGLEYSVFNSRIIHSIADDSHQSVQYIGIPLRYERTVTHNDKLDAYLGIGPTLDFCISAKVDGNSITKNPLDLSIAGVSGLQFRLSSKAYAILESQLSWTLSDRIHPCPTYKTERPMMFSLSYGVRVNLN